MNQAMASYGAYRKVDVETASQPKLIRLLFNGAIQRVEQAKPLLHEKQRDLAHNHLVRAQEIVAELRNALDMKTGEIAVNLDRSYGYVQGLLMSANVSRDMAKLDEALEHLAELRDLWEEVFTLVTEGGVAAAAPRKEDAVGGRALLNVRG